jgi:DNA-binding MarR family transcriptional regulator
MANAENTPTEADLRRVTETLKAIGGLTHIRILLAIDGEPRGSVAMAAEFGLAVPTVSNAIRSLVVRGLVRDVRHWKRRFYSPTEAGREWIALVLTLGAWAEPVR